MLAKIRYYLKKGRKLECSIYGKIPKKYYEENEEYQFINFYCPNFLADEGTFWYNLVKDKIEEQMKNHKRRKRNNIKN